MERNPKTLPKEYDGLHTAFDWIQKNALGNVLIAEDTPTSDTLKANQWTYYSDELFYRMSNGTAFKFTVTAI